MPSPPSKRASRQATIKMLLFIANVSVKRVLSYALFCVSDSSCVENRLSVGHSSFHWLSHRNRAPGGGRQENTKGSAFKTHLNFFVSLCKSSLLIGGAFSLFFARPPPVNPDFFLLFPPYAIVVFVHERPTRVCSSLSAHLSRWGERGGNGEVKKTFGKLIAGKKKKWYREKECIQPPRWRRERARKKNVKEKIVLPRTDDEYTNIFKKRNM